MIVALYHSLTSISGHVEIRTLAMQLHKYRVDIGTKDEKQHHKKLPSVLPVFVLGVKKTKGDDMMTPYGKRVRSIVH